MHSDKQSTLAFLSPIGAGSELLTLTRWSNKVNLQSTLGGLEVGIDITVRQLSRFCEHETNLAEIGANSCSESLHPDFFSHCGCLQARSYP